MLDVALGIAAVSIQVSTIIALLTQPFLSNTITTIFFEVASPGAMILGFPTTLIASLVVVNYTIATKSSCALLGVYGADTIRVSNAWVNDCIPNCITYCSREGLQARPGGEDKFRIVHETH